MRDPLIIISLFILLFSGCDINSESKIIIQRKESVDTTTPNIEFDDPQSSNYKLDSNYQKGLVIATMNDCMSCHKINDKLVGPAFKAIANRYANVASPEIIDTLAKKILNGGTGKWGEGVMTPHPNLSLDDARTVVKYVLLLKN